MTGYPLWILTEIILYRFAHKKEAAYIVRQPLELSYYWTIESYSPNCSRLKSVTVRSLSKP